MLHAKDTRRAGAASRTLYGAAAWLLLSIGTAAQGTTWYVDDLALPGQTGTAWGPFSAFKDLQDALAVAQPGDEIWVAGGVYRPDMATGSASSTFHLPAGVKLYGGFLGNECCLADRPALDAGVESILSGDLNGDDAGFQNNGENSLHVVTASLTDSESRLDRFVIQGGHARAGGDDGGGLYSTGGDLTISDCTFRWNMASGASTSSNGRLGAGIYAINGDPRILGCRFEHNDSNYIGGAVYLGNTSAEVSDCIFVQNLSGGTSSKGGGGAIAIRGGGAPVVSSSLFLANECRTAVADGGGAIWIREASGAGGSVPTFVGLRFLGNTSESRGGALFLRDSVSTLINCAFSGNEAATEGGAVSMILASTLDLLGSTLTGNAAGTLGGGLHADGTSAPSRVANTILWGNTDSGFTAETAQVHMTTAGGLPIAWSLVEGWTGPGGPVGGSDIKTLDPEFVNALGTDGVAGTEDDDLSLPSRSPGVDAGNNGDVGLDLADLDGDGVTLEPTPFDVTGAPRIFDDPATPTTGSLISGDLVVDLGAYEFSGPTTLAMCVTRNGSGINPLDYICNSLPILGTTWTATIATPPGTVWTAIAFSAAGPTSGSFVLGGELLILPPIAAVDTAFGTHAFPLVDDPSWIGVTLYSQGLRFELAAGAVPLNAIDLTLGH